LSKRYQNMAKHLAESRSDDVFQLYANAVTSVYDPHTNYFSPRTGEDFDINMSLSLEGIGAQLTLEDEVITIKELIAGGPAKQSGKLARNDKILAVAQGQTGAMEDVVGWRLDDAVRLIRGKRGTTVRLRIEKAINDEVVDVVLVRDKIKLEESAAKSEIKGIEKDGKVYRIGIIDLPSFYIDFDAANRGEKNYRSTTRDVKRLIQQLEKDGIDGLMIDLRDNGGGSLAEAVDLTGLFFDKGPVVQVRRAGGEVTVHADDDNETIYDGPLAVLINQNSASASEIFAGAIKDYGRGVILGEPTFGKGTVQTVIDLARFLPSVKDSVGQLKMTIAMFYRVNGSSTQLKGVTPNIYIPNENSYLPGGESEEDHALPWHKIKGKKHQQFNQVTALLPTLQRDYEQDNANNPLMQTLLAMTAWQKQQSEDTIVPLSLKKRHERRDAIRDKSLRFQNAFRKFYGYPQLTADYWEKKDKDKTDAEIDADEQYEVDPILSIATTTAADYVRLLQQPHAIARQ
ncbi:MAG: tail-specific protease, partial [Gammaproteobacteria bacterium]